MSPGVTPLVLGMTVADFENCTVTGGASGDVIGCYYVVYYRMFPLEQSCNIEQPGGAALRLYNSYCRFTATTIKGGTSTRGNLASGVSAFDCSRVETLATQTVITADSLSSSGPLSAKKAFFISPSKATAVQGANFTYRIISFSQIGWSRHAILLSGYPQWLLTSTGGSLGQFDTLTRIPPLSEVCGIGSLGGIPPISGVFKLRIVLMAGAASYDPAIVRDSQNIVPGDTLASNSPKVGSGGTLSCDSPNTVPTDTLDLEITVADAPGIRARGQLPTYAPRFIRTTETQNGVAFFFETGGESNIALEVHDVAGRLVWRQVISKSGSGLRSAEWIFLPNSRKSTGVFIVTCQGLGRRSTGKFILLR